MTDETTGSEAAAQEPSVLEVAMAQLAQNQAATNEKLDGLLNLLQHQAFAGVKNRKSTALDMGEAMEAKPEVVTETVDGLIVPATETEGEHDDLEFEKFMLEPVEMVITPSNDPQDQSIVFYGWNGANYVFRRGVPRIVPRAVVAVVAQSVERKYQSVENENKEAENRFKYVQFTGLKHQFQVTRDSEKGFEWCRRLREQEGLF